MKMLNFIKKYFSDKLTPLVRYLHYLILVFVILQIIISNFIEVSSSGEIGQSVVEYYSTWMHISIGLSLLLLSIIFIIIELRKHGISYFYPYLRGNITQLKSDINQLRIKEIPEVSPGGLAATVQGLGLGALLLVVLSGTTWFLLWSYGLSLADDVKEIHELFTALIGAYVIGHGSMGLIHIFITYKNSNRVNGGL